MSFNDAYLINIAKDSEPAARLTDVEKFILDLKIMASRSRVEGQIIYWKYVRWCKENKKKILTRRKFFRQFRIRFEKVNASRKKCYRVNPEPFKVNPEEWWDMRRHYKLEKIKGKMNATKKQRKKERQIQSKKSRTQETL